MSQPICPACSGPHLADHPAGVVVFRHTVTCPLGEAEDATAAADADRLAHHGRFGRPVTATEHVLLAALGFDLPTGAATLVEDLTPAVRRRSWPTAVPTASTAVSA